MVPILSSPPPWYKFLVMGNVLSLEWTLGDRLAKARTAAGYDRARVEEFAGLLALGVWYGVTKA